MSRIALCLILAVSASANPDAQKLVTRYCFACHNSKLKSGNVSLEGVKASDIPAHGDTWERVLRKVRTGEMPPPKLPRPDAATTRTFVNWLEAELDGLALKTPNPGTPAIHRLNRAEYSNAIRDLLALEMDHSAALPADDSGYGFDNIGDVLTVSPLLMEKYMSSARRVARLAVGTVKFPKTAAVERFNASGAYGADTSGLPLNMRGSIQVRRFFPADAEYALTVRVRGNPMPGTPPGKLDLRVDGERVKLWDAEIDSAEERQSSRNFEIRVPLTAGMHTIGAGFLTEYTKGENPPVPRGPQAPPAATALSVDYLLIGGPFDPKGPGETESRKRIFVCRPGKTIGEIPCARKIITTVAHRAYRRPSTQADVLPLMKLFAAGRKDGGSFDSGIEMALRGILVSPNFLFRREQAPKTATPGTPHKISEIELASRLSFFLWSSIPDDELLRVAEAGRLRATLQHQVRRMLADAKSKSLIENFAGQWLHLRNIASWRPDPDRYPQFDDSLRFAFQRETELFFEYIVRNDRPITEFLNANYTFVNERLARHYGMPGVKGSYFRKVDLAMEERGGIVTHGGILTVTSYPTRTSPVLRGKWILDNILGAPPPPPPPDVPDLEDSASISAADLRKALEKHRANAACASCHDRLDPLGFALENFDATGRFRKVESGQEIDASAVMPGGGSFFGPGGLKKVLTERSDQFVEALSEKLLTYAVGRGIEHPDLPAVRKIRRQTVEGEYRFSALVQAIVESVPFQMRRTPEK
jgi:hypothetical protein